MSPRNGAIVTRVIRPVQHNRRHRDRRSRRQATLDLVEARVARGIAVAVAVEWITTGTKSGLSKDGAVRSKVASSKCQVGDHSSQKPADITAMLFEAHPTPLSVKVPLVPERPLCLAEAGGCATSVFCTL